jgi:hypothetical protein
MRERVMRARREVERERERERERCHSRDVRKRETRETSIKRRLERER